MTSKEHGDRLILEDVLDDPKLGSRLKYILDTIETEMEDDKGNARLLLTAVLEYHLTATCSSDEGVAWLHMTIDKIRRLLARYKNLQGIIRRKNHLRKV